MDRQIPPAPLFVGCDGLCHILVEWVRMDVVACSLDSAEVSASISPNPFPIMLLRAIICLPLVVSAFAAERSPVVSAEESPVLVEKIGDGKWFIDFGKAAFGNVVITSPDAKAGEKITVHLGEAIADPKSVNRNPGGTVRYQRHEVALRPNMASSPTLSWSPPGWMKDGWLNMPKQTGQVMPFRYVEIENAPPSFSADHIRRISWAVAFDDQASAFISSDPDLNAVWDFCKYSIKATSFMGIYVDGDRERKPYEADVLINQLSHYCVDAEYETARYSHEYLLDNPTWPTEWRLQSVILGWNDFLWSGDDQSLRQHYPTLKGRAMIRRRTADGLFRGWNDGEIKDIVDWPSGERDNYDMRPEVKTVVTAFHYQALVLLEKIAMHLGKTADAREFAELAKITYDTVNSKLWDEENGRYVDGLDPSSGEVSRNASAHANFFPLALGLVPPDRVERVSAFLKPRGMACSVYGAQFLLDALYDAGEAEHALGLLTSRDLRSWLNMVEKVGSTIALEAWDPSLKPNLDWNHAWGAAPSNLIARRLMGIEPLEPGFKRFRIRPQTATLESAKIKMPSPRGPIILEVYGTDAASWRAVVVVPAGTGAEFHVPHTGEVVANGPSKPRSLRKENERDVLGLLPGRWTITMAK